MEMMDSNNWLIDYEMMDDISSAVSATTTVDFSPPATIDFGHWASPTVNYSSCLTTSYQFEETEVSKEARSRKRFKIEACVPSGTKACREKMRRDLINEKFLELSSVLEPTRMPKTDKIAILSGAVRAVTLLQNEIEKLKESNSELLEQIQELKAEKSELRDEKQKLKEDKRMLEQQVRALVTKSGLSRSPLMGTTLGLEEQVAGKKLIPFVGYPGFAMWQFMQPTIVDTSQDHVLHPPVA